VLLDAGADALALDVGELNGGVVVFDGGFDGFDSMVGWLQMRAVQPLQPATCPKASASGDERYAGCSRRTRRAYALETALREIAREVEKVAVARRTGLRVRSPSDRHSGLVRAGRFPGLCSTVRFPGLCSTVRFPGLCPPGCSADHFGMKLIFPFDSRTAHWTSSSEMMCC
jgi:hypothetical protein